MKKIGIICAMEEEISLILKKFSLKKNDDKNFLIYEGEKDGKKIILLHSKIGKIFSGAGTSHLIHKYGIDFILNIGFAGGLKKGMKIGDIFQATKIIQHDAVLPWEISETSKHFLGEINLEKIDGIPDGTCLTGDQFISEKSFVEKLSKKGDFVEMEAFSIASICKIYGKKSLILKIISDGGDEKDFDKNIKKSFEKTLNIFENIFDKIKI